MRAWAVLALFFIRVSSAAQQDEPYRSLIQQALDERSLCLGETTWPVTSRAGTEPWLNARMEALVDAGLVVTHQEGHQKVWALSHKGRAEYHRHHDFCYGRMRVGTIREIHPQRDGVQVTFTYALSALPEWAKNASLRMADTELDNLISGNKNVRYQAFFTRDAHGKLRLTRSPEPLDLLY
ncbi:CpmK protein [Cronobacter dublinensis]